MQQHPLDPDGHDIELADRNGPPHPTSEPQAHPPQLIITSEDHQDQHGQHDQTAPAHSIIGGNNLIHGIQGIMSVSGNGSLAENVRTSISTLASHRDRSRPRPMGRDKMLEEPGLVDTLAPERVKKQPTLLNLPPEVQLLILRHLEFADIERLRRTCKYLRRLANPATIRIIMGDSLLQSQLLGHCHACLLRDPFRSRLLLGSKTDPGWPLNNKCIDCALRANDDRIRVGKKVVLASLAEVWVCRWCGFPITEGAAAGNEQFHRPCHLAFNNVLVYFFLLGWLQFSLGVVAAALAWKYWRFTKMVFAPTVTSFLLLWVILFMLIFRGNNLRTYHITLVLELCALGLWIPPVYYLASEIASHPDEPVPKHTKAALTMFGLNLLFRLVNVLGNVVLYFEYEITKANLPNAPWWRKLVNPIFAGLIFWTYPQTVERSRLVSRSMV